MSLAEINKDLSESKNSLLVEGAKLEEENRILRRLLALALAHYRPGHMIYGDDGELQCNTCWIDFVRDSAQDIQKKLHEAGIKEWIRLQGEKK